MEIRENNKICIIAPLVGKLDKRQSIRIFETIKKDSRKIGIDLNYVSDCTYDFIEEIQTYSKTNKIGIFNIPSDLFSLFNVMEIDKFAQLFVSEQDFLNNSRQLINRKFAVV